MKKKQSLTLGDSFHWFATRASALVGTKWAFLAAVAGILAWGVTGPRFHYSNTWQLVVNTGTTVVTFLMVFLIQNTQNRDARAIHLKLDEIIHAIQLAHNDMIDIENLSDEELETLSKKYAILRKERRARKNSKSGAAQRNAN
ncbi:MAG TPA: low affinity iron permease family protein [Terriglobales bacterium]|nr:low affinity iron permease family protein [Terriglobales bacterium]